MKGLKDLGLFLGSQTLAGRREAATTDLADFAATDSPAQRTMVDTIRKTLNLTSLKYQTLDDLIDAIGLPKCKLCTYCWDGANPPEGYLDGKSKD